MLLAAGLIPSVDDEGENADADDGGGGGGEEEGESDGLTKRSDENVHSRIHLVDVGIGCGDQSLYLMQKRKKKQGKDERLFDSYVGLTLASSQAEYARRRVSQAEKSSTTTTTGVTGQVRIFCADAANPESWSEDLKRAVDAAGLGGRRGASYPNTTTTSTDSIATTETLDRTSTTTPAAAHQTWLLALDTLYHFHPSREPLLHYAQSHLHASLMAFDLLLSDSASTLDKFLLRLVCLFTGTPYSNFLTEAQYVDMLVKRVGYDRAKIEVRDVSDRVFPGIAKYMQRRERELRRFGMTLGKFRAAGKVFGWWARSGIVRGVIVVARRNYRG